MFLAPQRLGLLAPNFLDDFVAELNLLPLLLFGQLVAVVGRGETGAKVSE